MASSAVAPSEESGATREVERKSSVVVYVVQQLYGSHERGKRDQRE